ncbi:hypothetical protein ACLMJK_008468 [Lecanora helva]
MFIVHSLGGWILMQAMIDVKSSPYQDDRINHQSTYSAIFLGVPGQGMDVKGLTDFVADAPAKLTLTILDQECGFKLRSKQHRDFCDTFDYKGSKMLMNPDEEDHRQV